MVKNITETIDNMMIKYRDYGGLIVAVVLFIFFFSMRVFIRSFMDLSIERWRFISPAFWPGWVLLLGLILSAFLVYSEYQKLRARQMKGPREELPEDSYEREMTLRAKYQKGGAILSVRELEALADAQIKATQEKSTSTELFRLLSVLLLTFVYLYLIRIMGFIVSTLFFSFGYLFLLKERRPLVLIISPLALIAVIWIVFTRLLVVPLPRGVGIFQLISNFFY
jgi:hypothetical protein